MESALQEQRPQQVPGATTRTQSRVAVKGGQKYPKKITKKFRFIDLPKEQQDAYHALEKRANVMINRGLQPGKEEVYSELTMQARTFFFAAMAFGWMPLTGGRGLEAMGKSENPHIKGAYDNLKRILPNLGEL